MKVSTDDLTAAVAAASHLPSGAVAWKFNMACDFSSSSSSSSSSSREHGQQQARHSLFVRAA
jgi:hypothetical protein